MEVYVDDILLISPELHTIQDVIKYLKTKFDMTQKKPHCLVGMSMEVKLDESIHIGQQSFVRDLLQKFNMVNCNYINVPMQHLTELVAAVIPVVLLPICHLVGDLLVLAWLKRPDLYIAYALGK